EKERERMSSLRVGGSGGHMDALNLNDSNIPVHNTISLSNSSLPAIGSLSELMVTNNGHSLYTTGANHGLSHNNGGDSHANTGAGGLYGGVGSRPTQQSSPHSNLNFLNLSQFDAQSIGGNHSSIDDLLGLSGGGRGLGSIPPLVSPLPHHSSLLSSQQSQSRGSSDESSEANHLLLSNIANYASMVSTSGAPTSLSSTMPFLLDTITSPQPSSICSLQSSSTLMSRFESQIRTIANDIQTTIQLHLNGLQMRKEQLLKQLEHIKQTYATVLSIAAQTDESLAVPLPQITFTRPDSALYKAVTTLGFLTTPALAVNCSATGDGVEAAIEGEATCFTITTRNCFNEELLIGGEHLDIEVLVTDPNSMSSSITIPHSLLDHNNGKYTVTYTIPRGLKLGQVHVSVSVNGLPITGSPFVVSIESQRVRNAWKRIATFGTEGSQIGQFCRPWGVAIVRLPNKEVHPFDHMSNSRRSPGAGREYLIAVADRSNNRIQLLKLSLSSAMASTSHSSSQSNSTSSIGSNLSNNGFGAHGMGNGGDDVSMSVLHVFGSGPGTRPGQFDRPAGIAINVQLGHIIVADKDNHRIQVFDISGTYLFKFGEKGSRPGQFCYPWDIDSCDQTSQILVSDTRNRRVQLFTPYGQYLWHCGQPLDSPRGVSFISSDKFVISDFNKHRLLVIDKTNASSKEDVTPKYIGFGEGSAWGEFLRPQGVVSSGATAIFCADSRNNRISIWNSATQSFDYLGEEVLSLDRPSGLAVTDNLLVVVDFGNNRIQICQR
ncbi:unnamed protein product, partial [Oppiella nova]